MFVPGILAAATLAAVVMLPVALMYRRATVVVPLVALALVLSLQWRAITHPTRGVLTFTVMLYDLVCLGAILPALLHWLTPKLRGRIVDAA
jgi:hypothetical protein